MSLEIGRLTSLVVSRTKLPGMYPDGGGLYLQVTDTGTRSWIFRFAINGRERQMGLGPLYDVSLSDARKKAEECRRLKREGTDPIEVRRASRMRARLDAAKAITFKSAAEAFVKSQRSGWSNAKHAAQWEMTLKTYVYPVFGELPVQDIDVGLVLKSLEPIWEAKPETAGRVRGRIEGILDWASVRGYRNGENPARWRGCLDKVLPPRSKVRQVRHHAALTYTEIPEFIASLREQEGVSARALEFLILTAARTAEVIGARWDEMDVSGKRWIVPAERMKGRKVHRVPLSNAALKVLETMSKTRVDDFVFPGGRSKRPLSNMAMLTLLRRMGRDDLTAQGFRSTFRDWVAEKTNYAAELAEIALAHSIGNKVEAAYRRGDMFEKRRELMKDWGAYCLET